MVLIVKGTAVEHFSHAHDFVCSISMILSFNAIYNICGTYVVQTHKKKEKRPKKKYNILLVD